MSYEKIVFPRPPPTTNILTPEQRAQLMRRTKKLGQLLGTTPRLVDPKTNVISRTVHINIPSHCYDKPSLGHRGSVDSMSSMSSRSSSQSRRSTLSRSSSRASQSSADTDYSFESWPKSGKPPCLRLSVASSGLETIPASPPFDGTFQNSEPYVLQTIAAPSEQKPFTRPQFVLPSESTIRRQKMDRLRRKLGEGVPAAMVFSKREEPEQEVIQAVVVSTSSEATGSLVLSSPSPRAKRSPNRICHTRDSIGDLSPHRALRQTHSTSPTTSLKPLPPLPISRSSSLLKGEALCVIIESPDEHGGGCTEEFGWGTSSTQNERYYASDGGSQVRLWSTRKGYQGWAPTESRDSTFDKVQRRSLIHRKPPPLIEC